MTLEVASVTLDCNSPRALARFWCAALGYEVENDYGEFVSLRGTNGGPGLNLQAVREPKAGKNRAHIDLSASDREAEVRRLLGLGAREVERHRVEGFEWVVMADPEGNEFCVAQH